jgi:hypothetical protein
VDYQADLRRHGIGTSMSGSPDVAERLDRQQLLVLAPVPLK